MKTLSQYTPEEKIKMFDGLYQQCLEHLNGRIPDADGWEEEYDVTNFWEGTVGDMLDMTEEDWEKHNDGKILP